jgi:hypothetical protein
MEGQSIRIGFGESFWLTPEEKGVSAMAEKLYGVSWLMPAGVGARS